MNTLHIKSGDTVVVLSGKDKGKKGKVLSTNLSKGLAVVEGIAITAHHVKPRKQGAPGGIIQKETAVRACKLMRVCPKCDKPTRPAHSIDAAGKKTTVCKKCGAAI